MPGRTEAAEADGEWSDASEDAVKSGSATDVSKGEAEDASSRQTNKTSLLSFLPSSANRKDPVHSILDKIDAELAAMVVTSAQASASTNRAPTLCKPRSSLPPLLPKAKPYLSDSRDRGGSSNGLLNGFTRSTSNQQTISGSAEIYTDAVLTDVPSDDNAEVIISQQMTEDFLSDLDSLVAQQIDSRFKEIMLKKRENLDQPVPVSSPSFSGLNRPATYKDSSTTSPLRLSTTPKSATVGYGTDNESIRTEDFEQRFQSLVVLTDGYTSGSESVRKPTHKPTKKSKKCASESVKIGGAENGLSAGDMSNGHSKVGVGNGPSIGSRIAWPERRDSHSETARWKVSFDTRPTDQTDAKVIAKANDVRLNRSLQHSMKSLGEVTRKDSDVDTSGIASLVSAGRSRSVSLGKVTIHQSRSGRINQGLPDYTLGRQQPSWNRDSSSPSSKGQSTASSRSTFEEVESLCLSRSSNDSFGQFRNASRNSLGGGPGASVAAHNQHQHLSGRFLSRQSSTTSTSTSSGYAAEYLEKRSGSASTTGSTYEDNMETLDPRQQFDLNEHALLDGIFRRVLEWNNAQAALGMGREGGVTGGGSAASVSLAANTGKTLPSPGRRMPDINKEKTSPTSDITHVKRRRDLIIPDEEDEFSFSRPFSRKSEVRSRQDGNAQNASPSGSASISTKQTSSESFMSSMSSMSQSQDLSWKDHLTQGWRATQRSGFREQANQGWADPFLHPWTRADADQQMWRDQTNSAASAASSGMMMPPGYQLTSPMLTRGMSMESMNSFGALPPPDAYIPPYLPASHLQNPAEMMLMNLGFGGSAEGFLPERFLRDWYNKISRTQGQFPLLTPHPAENNTTSLYGNATTVLPNAHNPQVHNSASKPKYEELRSASDLHRRLANPLNRAATVSTSQSHSNDPSETLSTLLPPCLGNEYRTVRLKEYVEATAENLSSSDSRSIRMRQFASSRQKSLPSYLEALTEEDEGKVRNVAYKPHDRESRLRAFLREDSLSTSGKSDSQSTTTSGASNEQSLCGSESDSHSGSDHPACNQNPGPLKSHASPTCSSILRPETLHSLVPKPTEEGSERLSDLKASETPSIPMNGHHRHKAARFDCAHSPEKQHQLNSPLKYPQLLQNASPAKQKQKPSNGHPGTMSSSSQSKSPHKGHRTKTLTHKSKSPRHNLLPSHGNVLGDQLDSESDKCATKAPCSSFADSLSDSCSQRVKTNIVSSDRLSASQSPLESPRKGRQKSWGSRSSPEQHLDGKEELMGFREQFDAFQEILPSPVSPGASMGNETEHQSKKAEKSEPLVSIESLEVADIFQNPGNRASNDSNVVEENSLGKTKSLAGVGGRGQLEPAMISIVLEDVDGNLTEKSLDLGLDLDHHQHQLRIQQLGESGPQDDRLHIPSRSSSLSVSPIPQSPVTVIEVRLDNQQDSLDTEEGTNSSKDLNEDDEMSALENDALSNDMDSQIEEAGTREFPQFVEYCVERGLSCANYYSDGVSDKEVSKISNAYVDADDGNISPILLFNATSPLTSCSSSPTVAIRSSGVSEMSIQADDGALSPLIRLSYRDGGLSVVSENEQELYFVSDQGVQCNDISWGIWNIREKKEVSEPAVVEMIHRFTQTGRLVKYEMASQTDHSSANGGQLSTPPSGPLSSPQSPTFDFRSQNKSPRAEYLNNNFESHRVRPPSLHFPIDARYDCDSSFDYEFWELLGIETSMVQRQFHPPFSPYYDSEVASAQLDEQRPSLRAQSGFEHVQPVPRSSSNTSGLQTTSGLLHCSPAHEPVNFSQHHSKPIADRYFQLTESGGLDQNPQKLWHWSAETENRAVNTSITIADNTDERGGTALAIKESRCFYVRPFPLKMAENVDENVQNRGSQIHVSLLNVTVSDYRNADDVLGRDLTSLSEQVWRSDPRSSEQDWRSDPRSSEQDWRSDPRSSEQGWGSDPRSSEEDWRSDQRTSEQGWGSDPRSSEQGWGSDPRSSEQGWGSDPRSSEQGWGSDPRSSEQGWGSDPRSSEQDWGSDPRSSEQDWRSDPRSSPRRVQTDHLSQKGEIGISRAVRPHSPLERGRPEISKLRSDGIQCQDCILHYNATRRNLDLSTVQRSDDANGCNLCSTNGHKDLVFQTIERSDCQEQRRDSPESLDNTRTSEDLPVDYSKDNDFHPEMDRPFALTQFLTGWIDSDSKQPDCSIQTVIDARDSYGVRNNRMSLDSNRPLPDKSDDLKAKVFEMFKLGRTSVGNDSKLDQSDGYSELDQSDRYSELNQSDGYSELKSQTQNKAVEVNCSLQLKQSDKDTCCNRQPVETVSVLGTNLKNIELNIESPTTGNQLLSQAENTHRDDNRTLYEAGANYVSREANDSCASYQADNNLAKREVVNNYVSLETDNSYASHLADNNSASHEASNSYASHQADNNCASREAIPVRNVTHVNSALAQVTNIFSDDEMDDRTTWLVDTFVHSMIEAACHDLQKKYLNNKERIQKRVQNELKLTGVFAQSDSTQLDSETTSKEGVWKDEISERGSKLKLLPERLADTLSGINLKVAGENQGISQVEKQDGWLTDFEDVSSKSTPLTNEDKITPVILALDTGKPQENSYETTLEPSSEIPLIVASSSNFSFADNEIEIAAMDLLGSQVHNSEVSCQQEEDFACQPDHYLRAFSPEVLEFGAYLDSETRSASGRSLSAEYANLIKAYGSVEDCLDEVDNDFEDNSLESDPSDSGMGTLDSELFSSHSHRDDGGKRIAKSDFETEPLDVIKFSSCNVNSEGHADTHPERATQGTHQKDQNTSDHIDLDSNFSEPRAEMYSLGAYGTKQHPGIHLDYNGPDLIAEKDQCSEDIQDNVIFHTIQANATGPCEDKSNGQDENLHQWYSYLSDDSEVEAILNLKNAEAVDLLNGKKNYLKTDQKHAMPDANPEITAALINSEQRSENENFSRKTASQAIFPDLTTMETSLSSSFSTVSEMSTYELDFANIQSDERNKPNIEAVLSSGQDEILSLATCEEECSKEFSQERKEKPRQLPVTLAECEDCEIYKPSQTASNCYQAAFNFETVTESLIDKDFSFSESAKKMNQNKTLFSSGYSAVIETNHQAQQPSVAPEEGEDMVLTEHLMASKNKLHSSHRPLLYSVLEDPLNKPKLLSAAERRNAYNRATTERNEFGQSSSFSEENLSSPPLRPRRFQRSFSKDSNSSDCSPRRIKRAVSVGSLSVDAGLQSSPNRLFVPANRESLVPKCLLFKQNASSLDFDNLSVPGRSSPIPGADISSPIPGVDISSPIPGVDISSPIPGVDISSPIPGIDISSGGCFFSSRNSYLTIPEECNEVPLLLSGGKSLNVLVSDTSRTISEVPGVFLSPVGSPDQSLANISEVPDTSANVTSSDLSDTDDSNLPLRSFCSSDERWRSVKEEVSTRHWQDFSSFNKEESSEKYCPPILTILGMPDKLEDESCPDRTKTSFHERKHSSSSEDNTVPLQISISRTFYTSKSVRKVTSGGQLCPGLERNSPSEELPVARSSSQSLTSDNPGSPSTAHSAPSQISTLELSLRTCVQDSPEPQHLFTSRLEPVFPKFNAEHLMKSDLQRGAVVSGDLASAAQARHKSAESQLLLNRSLEDNLSPVQSADVSPLEKTPNDSELLLNQSHEKELLQISHDKNGHLQNESKEHGTLCSNWRKDEPEPYNQEEERSQQNIQKDDWPEWNTSKEDQPESNIPKNSWPEWIVPKEDGPQQNIPKEDGPQSTEDGPQWNSAVSIVESESPAPLLKSKTLSSLFLRRSRFQKHESKHCLPLNFSSSGQSSSESNTSPRRRTFWSTDQNTVVSLSHDQEPLEETSSVKSCIAGNQENEKSQNPVNLETAKVCLKISFPFQSQSSLTDHCESSFSLLDSVRSNISPVDCMNSDSNSHNVLESSVDLERTESIVGKETHIFREDLSSKSCSLSRNGLRKDTPRKSVRELAKQFEERGT